MRCGLQKASPSPRLSGAPALIVPAQRRRSRAAFLPMRRAAAMVSGMIAEMAGQANMMWQRPERMFWRLQNVLRSWAFLPGRALPSAARPRIQTGCAPRRRFFRCAVKGGGRRRSNGSGRCSIFRCRARVDRPRRSPAKFCSWSQPGDWCQGPDLRHWRRGLSPLHTSRNTKGPPKGGSSRSRRKHLGAVRNAS